MFDLQYPWTQLGALHGCTPASSRIASMVFQAGTQSFLCFLVAVLTYDRPRLLRCRGPRHVPFAHMFLYNAAQPFACTISR